MKCFFEMDITPKKKFFFFPKKNRISKYYYHYQATKKDAEDEKDEKMEEEIESSEENNKVEDQQPKPRALHKTTSIFLRNLAPTITKQEVEAMCKRYPGFLRAAIADPQPERRWFRRGWITFERDVKIKEICYSLNNIRLR